MQAFKDCMRNLSHVPVQTDKNMQALIEKHLLPVLMD